jgi:hypothetical protein
MRLSAASAPLVHVPRPRVTAGAFAVDMEDNQSEIMRELQEAGLLGEMLDVFAQRHARGAQCVVRAVSAHTLTQRRPVSCRWACQCRAAGAQRFAERLSSKHLHKGSWS